MKAWAFLKKILAVLLILSFSFSMALSPPSIGATETYAAAENETAPDAEADQTDIDIGINGSQSSNQASAPQPGSGSVAVDSKVNQSPGEAVPPVKPGVEEAPEAERPATFAMLAPSTQMSYAELVGDNGDYRPIGEVPPTGTYKAVVNVYYQFVTVFKKDGEGNYTVPVRYMACSTGTTLHPTRIGTFKIPEEKHRFKSFVDFACSAQYWTKVVADTYFHSILYAREDARYITNSSYRNIGKRASHGCIRLMVPDARWLYYNLAPGTEVSIIRGKKDTAQAAIKKQLVYPKVPKEKPDLSAGAVPVTEAWPGYTVDLAGKLPIKHEAAYIGAVTSKTSVKAGASSEHGSIGTLLKGAKVEILKDGNSLSYYRIIYNDSTGYIPASRVTITSQDNPGWVNAIYASVTGTGSEVKSAASGKSKTLFTLETGTKVMVLAQSMTWARIQYYEQIGYMRLAQLKPEN
ncbi:MAG: SH3 domain-containing protein [Christensenellales bacterium]